MFCGLFLCADIFLAAATASYSPFRSRFRNHQGRSHANRTKAVLEQSAAKIGLHHRRPTHHARGRKGSGVRQMPPADAQRPRGVGRIVDRVRAVAILFGLVPRKSECRHVQQPPALPEEFYRSDRQDAQNFSLDKTHLLNWSKGVGVTTSQNDAISVVQRRFNWTVEHEYLHASLFPKSSNQSAGGEKSTTRPTHGKSFNPTPVLRLRL
ncbi:hypothetical protein Pla52o_32190 [Novipirellula galeiformis]|uniref:Uncharacterized protein n=1 Tax=Novipirellula galeiformis TaxID=2528004 RepID=A0A5C6CFZ7_9BACT|nr:hypothetical protein Pla52o_32190 [Novipirellula galeiformis]